MKKFSTFASLFTGAIILLSFAGQVSAAGSNYGGEVTSKCDPIYGGGEVCKQISTFTIDKAVQSPSKGGQFVDNLGANSEKFAPNKEVTYKITIKNTGKKTIEKIDVADTLPSYLDFSAGAGNFNKDTRVISYSISNLEAGKTHEYTFKARTAQDASLPQDKGIVCPVNKVRAIDNSGASAEDASEICIQKTIPGKNTPEVFKNNPVKETPSTGPEALALIGLIPAGATGIYLRRKSIK